MEWSERIYLAYGPTGRCFMCGGETVKWLRPESTGTDDFVASHIACAAKVLIAYEEYRRTGRIPERQMRWLAQSRRKALPAPS
jgi:hypothetical protein